MPKPKLILMLVLCLFFLASCATPHYIVLDSSQIKTLLDKGDKVIRERIEPKEVEVPWNGVLLSEAEYRRLQDLAIR